MLVKVMPHNLKFFDEAAGAALTEGEEELALEAEADLVWEQMRK